MIKFTAPILLQLEITLAEKVDTYLLESGWNSL